MNKKQCKNGHFYDGGKYSSCPFCEGDETFNFDDDDSPTVSTSDFSDDFGDISTASFQTEPGWKTTSESTVPAWDPEDDMNTIRGNIDGVDIQKTLVVGWLVATKGIYTGESFPIISGRNFIGRNKNYSVNLEKDKTVSRSRHAIIIFEPKTRVFFVAPGDSTELFYLNDKVVLGSEEIKAYDRLKIGDTELLFIPLCGENFAWDIELRKN